MKGLRYFDLHTHTERMGEAIVSVLDIPLSDWERQEDVAKRVPFSISLHPCCQTMDQLAELQNWVDNHRDEPNWIALGEMGFDPCSSLSPEERMLHFETVARIAEERKKFLIIHCVRGFSALRQAYDHIRPKQTWVLHGFRKNSELMRQWLLPSIAFSIGFHQLESLIEEVPLDRVFLETDDQIGESIEEIYQKFADRRGLQMELLLQQIEHNYNRITHINSKR